MLFWPPRRPFCALELPTVFRTRFWRSPESILGAILASKIVIFDHVVPGPVDSFVELIFHRCLLRAPSEICLLRALREKGTCGLRPTKTNVFQDFCKCAVAPATQQGRQQRTKYRIEIGPKKLSSIRKMLSCCLSAWTSPKKAFKNALMDPPRAPPRGANRPKTPKIRQEGLKTVPRALHAIFQLPLFRPERPPQAWRRKPIWDPPGGEI